MHLTTGETRLAPLYDLHSSLFFADKKIGRIELAARYGNDFTVHRSDSRDMLPTLAARLVIPLQALMDRAEFFAANISETFATEIAHLPLGTQIPDRMSAFMERLEIRAASCLKTVAGTRGLRGPP